MLSTTGHLKPKPCRSAKSRLAGADAHSVKGQRPSAGLRGVLRASDPFQEPEAATPGVPYSVTVDCSLYSEDKFDHMCLHVLIRLELSNWGETQLPHSRTHLSI